MRSGCLWLLGVPLPIIILLWLITGHAFRHLGLAEPARDPAQFGLFAADDDD